MNSTAVFFVGSEAVSASRAGRVADFDTEASRRAEGCQGSSFSERAGLSRTSSGMAGSLKGGLATLLSSSPATTGLSTSHAHRFSDHLSLSSMLSSDLSSVSSLPLSGSCVTPRSKDKSPTSWALSVVSNRMIPHGSSPGALPSVFPAFSSSVASVASRGREKLPGTFHLPARSSSLAYSPLSNMHTVHGSLKDLAAAGGVSDRGFGSVCLQAKPNKPSQTPFLRSVGFSIPGSLNHLAGPPLTPVPSLGQLSDQYPTTCSSSQAETSNEAMSRTSSVQDTFMTPVASLNTLVESNSVTDLTKGTGLAGDGDRWWEHCQTFDSIYSGGDVAAVPVSWKVPVLESDRNQGSPIAAPSKRASGVGVMEGRGVGGISRQRKDILSFVEQANGLRDPGPGSAEHELLRKAQKEHPIFHDQLVCRAYEFAATAHMGQVRKNGDPLIAHCLETAAILANIGAGSEVVAAGLLHDCLDDTPMTAEQLEASFGASIADLVRGVSNLSTLSQRMRDSEGALSVAEEDRLQRSGRALSEGDTDRLRRMILSMADVRVVLVKLADRLHNLRTLAALPPEKQRRVASETLEVFAPLANRLGIWTWKAEIEDICFRTLWPQDHRALGLAVQGNHGDEAVLRSIAKLDAELRRSSVGFTDLHGRAKNLYSIFMKMRSKGKSLEQVFDRRGIRLIVPDERSCYEALAAVRSVWSQELKDHFKDYIEEPKGNGYQSIHVVVEDEDGHPLEIQIRTEAMHHTAEYGVAAHWRYKEKRKGVQCGSCSTKRSASHEADAEEAEHEEDVLAATQRVEWMRYVLSWVAELTDMKVRLPEEGCEGECSSAGRRASPGAASPPRGFLGNDGICQFPEHRDSCVFKHVGVACAHAAPRPPVPESEPLLVVVVEGEKLSVRRLQGDGTREGFLRDYLEEKGKLHMLHQASLIINSELASVSRERFQIGDVLEVILDAPHSPQGLNGLGPAPQPPHIEEELLFEADVALEMDLDFEAGGELLPDFARQECPLALEFQRRRLAVAFGSSDGLVLEPAQKQFR